MKSLRLGQSFGGKRFVLEPEYRSLQEIVDDALAAGVHPFVLGPAGIIEVNPPHPTRVCRCRIDEDAGTLFETP